MTLTRAVGTKGTMWLDDQTGSGNVEAADGDIWLDDGHSARIVPVPDRLQITTALPVEPDHARSVVPFARLYEHLERRIDGNPITDGPQPTTFADGVAVMRVLDAARQSSASGGAWISVSP
jgi:predicted dehydrogenase